MLLTVFEYLKFFRGFSGDRIRRRSGYVVAPPEERSLYAVSGLVFLCVAEDAGKRLTQVVHSIVKV